MRAYMIALALCATTVVGAQTPVGPVAPASAKPKSSSVELRVGGILINGDRTYEFLSNVESETGSIKGVDFLLRGKAAGITFRSLTGTFGTQPHVTSADARLLLFPQVFSIVVGAGRRALWSDFNAASPSQFDVGIAGVSSTIRIGGSGLRTNVSGAIYLPAGQTKDKIKSGMEGEASILYAIPKLPLFLQIGYRTELFTSKGTNFETPEEVRGIRLGGGLQLGGR